MLKVNNILELIGRTPLVRLNKMAKGLEPEIWVKLEFYNPTGSVKDRIAYYMIEEAEKRGELRPGATIVEPTSGNTGIALAAVCAVKGYRMIAVMPETMTIERRKMIKAFGAEVVLTPAAEDVAGAIRKAEELARTIPDAFMPDQFKNPDNIKAHAETTAREILEQTDGKIDCLVVAAGTGGTLSGVASVLKSKLPELRVCVVEPAGSAVLSGCEAGTHRIQGIGEGFIPENLKCNCYDEVIAVSDQEAIATARRLCREEAIFGGISSGANVFAALKMAQKMEKGTLITFICDSGQRYLTDEIYNYEV